MNAQVKAHDTERLANIAFCKRLAREGKLSMTQIAVQAGLGPHAPLARKYVAWPECDVCGTLLRKPSEDGMCGFCAVELGERVPV